ncbi:octanoyltransferase [Bacillus sp. FJAT-27986]|nr:octanoyltransferase [Bacillus sp. FJAT-27986]
MERGKMNLLQQDRWRIIDHSQSGMHTRAIQSFAIDDTLCASVGAGNSPVTARAWVHQKTVVLGIQDGRLPMLKQAADFLHEKGYDCIVRNSGGLAVVLDEGILNLTLVFPEKDRKIEINRGYDAMWELIKYMFRDFDNEIKAGEIVGSYCPGSYDLSIDGKKFAGISQRRIRHGVAVQIYLDINGDAEQRAALVRDFYKIALNGTETKFVYPTVNPKVMASLSDLLGVELTVNDVMLRLMKALQDHAGQIEMNSLAEAEMPLFESYLERMQDRNAKLEID